MLRLLTKKLLLTVTQSAEYVVYCLYPLVICYITMERSTMINGKIHYFDWVIFNSYVTNYQRVSSLYDFMIL